MYRMAVLTYEGAAFFELGCALELFALARQEFEQWYQCEVVALAQGPFEMLGGISMSVKQVTSLDAYDILLVPSWPVHQHQMPAAASAALNRFYDDGKRIVSFCSGAFLLAELGFLNGVTATTHWRYAEIFKARFPAVNYVDDILYACHGNIACSAGSSAAIDLGLEVIRQDFGYKAANSVARRLVISAHRKGGQSQFAESPVQSESGQFSAALDWAIANINDPIDIDQLASKACMSRRTFDRKFRADFNVTPKEWLTHQRLSLAKDLLERDTSSIEKVALLSGFSNATTMRHHFRKVLGISPVQHRERFASKA